MKMNTLKKSEKPLPAGYYYEVFMKKTNKIDLTIKSLKKMIKI